VADSIKALEQFFNDVIAQVIPGAFLLLVFCSIIGFEIPQHSLAIFIFFGISYSVGHIVLAIDETLRLTLKDIRDYFSKKQINDDEANKAKPVNSREAFIKLINEQNSEIDVTNLPVNELRSLAMSMSKEAADLGRRFMFLSLSCKSTVILLLIFLPFSTVFLLLNILVIYNIELSILCTILLQTTILTFLTLCVIYPVEKRSMNFKRRADEVPFSAAMAYLILKKVNSNEM
jgi:hypothetical protein